MQPLEPHALGRRIRFVLTDVDDTLTDGPRLPATAYTAMEMLAAAGIVVVPVTAAPAGWCDLMARMWPVGAVIGENGGLCFHREPAGGATVRRYWAEPEVRQRDSRRLSRLGEEIVAALPGAALAHDQRYREVTLAFHHSDRVLSDAIAAHLAAAGAQTTQNSIWVLGWFGDFDKLAMARRVMQEVFALDIEHDADCVVYVGDSINDAPMFGFFRNSVGVAGVRRSAERLPTLPRWITRGGGGAGFAEVAEALLAGSHTR